MMAEKLSVQNTNEHSESTNVNVLNFVYLLLNTYAIT
jgi:hypothetical protein